MSDTKRRVITAIVDESQLSLAIGRNGQNVRLASQLIGWQIDLYGSREWMELGADLSSFHDSENDDYETSDFSLEELNIAPEMLALLMEAGYGTFLQIIDFDRKDFLAIQGITADDADQLISLIDELTVVTDPSEAETSAIGEDALNEEINPESAGTVVTEISEDIPAEGDQVIEEENSSGSD
jgi:N utilization substance protein A